MAILDFIKPDKVIMIKSTETEGQFEFRPLEPGFGITIGNSIRRILLSSLEGNAITSVRIDGVPHEFSTIKVVVEDVTEIVLNLKKVRFKQQIKGESIVEIRDYFRTHFKSTVIALVSTSIGFLGYYFLLATGQVADILTTFGLGYMFDSIFNRWDKE